jgi:hypothetical protein
MLNAPTGSTLKIEYRSIDEFELDYKQEICDDSETLIQDHLWWNEPFTLYDQIRYPLRLTGDSNLIIDGIQGQHGLLRYVERIDDVFMAMGDYLKVIAVLETLSGKYDLDWQIFVMKTGNQESTIGYVEKGRADEAVVQYMIDTITYYEIPFEDISNESLRTQTYHKYFDESDEPIQDESY